LVSDSTGATAGSANCAVVLGANTCGVGTESISIGARTIALGTGDVVIGANSCIQTSNFAEFGNTVVGYCNCVCGNDVGGGIAIGFANRTKSPNLGVDRFSMSIGQRNLTEGFSNNYSVGYANCVTGGGGAWNFLFGAVLRHSGIYNTDLGFGNNQGNTTADYSTTTGLLNCACNSTCVVSTYGYGNIGSSDRVIGIGCENRVSATRSIAIGNANLIQTGGTAGIILGDQNLGTTGGCNNVILGQCNFRTSELTCRTIAIGCGINVTSPPGSDLSGSVLIGNGVCVNLSAGTAQRNIIIGETACVYGSAGRDNVVIGTCACSGRTRNVVIGNGARTNLDSELSIVIGSGSIVGGEGPISMGYQGIACNYGVGLGSEHRAQFNGSVAIGFSACANAGGAIAMGRDPLAECTGSVGVGYRSKSCAEGAVAIGHCALATHTGSYAFGCNLSTVIAQHVHVPNMFFTAPTGPYLDDAALYTAGETAGQVYISCLSGTNMLTVAGFN